MLEQSERFCEWADNINVKITIHGPQGEMFNMEVIHELEKQKDIRVNVTAMMSAQQCFLAAMGWSHMGFNFWWTGDQHGIQLLWRNSST